MVQGTAGEALGLRESQVKELIRSRKRSAFEVIEDILSNIDEKGIRKTLLANRAMLDYKVMEKYLNLLLSQGMVEIKSNGKVYITEKGRKFLEQYRNLKLLMEGTRTQAA